jgi:HAD superfamily phosphoserine phosphatase-like hydrolase
MARPFAVFDIDGTIIRWQLYHALADVLARDGGFDPEQYKAVKAARMEWKRRANSASFKEYEEMLVGIFSMALTNISVDKLNQACLAVIDEYKDQVYTYTRDLIAELKTKNYLIFAISASPEQIVKMLADYYRFDDAAGSKYEVENGHFTGQRDVLLGNRKPELLKEMINKHGV